ncbi:hypothetical protein Scep_026573 [Stephania cephalantha]|uniref:Uncharacterized protein n=1 Tax=Stephania cephalantha TaxID=152367 RepID=A0AAP0EKT6_9MAGN
MAEDDSYSTMERLCQISPSQEEHLRHCAFAGRPTRPAQTHTTFSGEQPSPSSSSSSDGSSPPVDPTGIRICSLESSDTDPEDEFRTPPEEPPQIATSKDTAAMTTNADEETRVCGSESAVALGGDTDLVFSEGKSEAADEQRLGLGLGFSVEKEGFLGHVNSVVKSELGFQAMKTSVESVVGTQLDGHGDGGKLVDPTTERRKLPQWIDETRESERGRRKTGETDSSAGNPTQSPSPSAGSLMDLLTMMSGQVDRSEDDEKAEDILEVARRAGMKIPRPRWWGDDPWWRKDGGGGR